MRHRLRDHAQFLTAPCKAGEEIEQQDGGEQNGAKTDHRQHAAALRKRLQRWGETVGQQSGAKQPDAGENAGERIDVAGRAALLNRLQNLADRFAVVVGGTARKARVISCQRFGMGAGIERVFERRFVH